MAIFERFYLYDVVSKCGKSISAHTENMLKKFKCIRRKRQDGLAVYGEYADRHKTESISANFWLKPKKFQILIHDRMGKKPSPATVPLKVLKCKIFDSAEFHDFYSMKTLWEGNFGVRINFLK